MCGHPAVGGKGGCGLTLSCTTGPFSEVVARWSHWGEGSPWAVGEEGTTDGRFWYCHNTTWPPVVPAASTATVRREGREG